MKKILLILFSLFLTLTFTACFDSVEKAVTETTSVDSNSGETGDTGKAYFYSSTGDSTIESTWGEWSTGTKIESDVVDTTYSKVIKLTGASGTWGTVLAFPGLQAGLFSEYTTLEFKVKSSDFTEVLVKLPEVEKKYLLSGGTPLTDGWVQMSIPLSDFESVRGTATEFAIFNIAQHGAGKIMYLTDIALTGKTTGVTTDTGTTTEGTTDEGSSTVGQIDFYSATAGTGIYTIGNNADWGHGSTIVSTSATQDSYSKVINVLTGSGWGGPAAVVAVNSLPAGVLTGKTELGVRFKALNTGADTTENIEIQMPGGGTTVTAYSTGANCKSWTTSNGWHEVKIDMSSFGNVANVSDIVFIVKDDTPQNMYFTDIYAK